MITTKEPRSFAPTLALLLLAVLINYVDRGNLALAAPMLKTEWGLSAGQLGILFSAFFWSYMTLQFTVGWLVDKYNVSVVMAVGFAVWSLSTAGTGLVTGFGALLLMRLVLGAGESVMFPCSSKICAQQLPEHRRGFANALIMAAIRWGSAVGTFGGGLMMARFGWRATFIAVGLFSLLWLPAWARWRPGPPGVGEIEQAGKPTVSAILRQRAFWGASLGHFCGNYLLYFLISWLPYYLIHERHLSMASMAGTAGVLYAVDSLSAIAAGWFADRRIRAGSSAATVRITTMAMGFAICAVALVSFSYCGPATYKLCLLVIGTGSGIGNSASFAVGQTLAGPRVAGRWIGLQNGVANISGIAGPPLTGFLIDWTGHFDAALQVAALVSVAGGLAWFFGVRKLEQVRWQLAPETVV